jgi:hypothetical protein
MIVFIGAIPGAIVAALQWGITVMPLVLKLLEMIAAGVLMVAIIRNQLGQYQIKPIEG